MCKYRQTDRQTDTCECFFTWRKYPSTPILLNTIIVVFSHAFSSSRKGIFFSIDAEILNQSLHYWSNRPLPLGHGSVLTYCWISMASILFKTFVLINKTSLKTVLCFNLCQIFFSTGVICRVLVFVFLKVWNHLKIILLGWF